MYKWEGIEACEPRRSNGCDARLETPVLDKTSQKSKTQQ